jgi:Domain of unknown function (DUF1906)
VSSVKNKYGVDYSRARPTRVQLEAVPAAFACRYLIDDARDRGKGLKLPEARQLSSWNVPIVANFEYAAVPLLTAAQGAADARTALAELEALGAPRRVVYFSFDYDVPPEHFPATMTYLKGAGSVLGAENVGAYGHYSLIEYLAGQGIDWLWQCFAWSGGRWSQWATCRQIRNGAFPGWDGDLNIAMADDIGHWRLPVPLEDDMEPSTGLPVTINDVPDQTYVAAFSPPNPLMTVAQGIHRNYWHTLQQGKVLTSIVGVLAKIDGLDDQTKATLDTSLVELRALSTQIAALPGADPQAFAETVAALINQNDAEEFLAALAAAIGRPK